MNDIAVPAASFDFGSVNHTPISTVTVRQAPCQPVPVVVETPPVVSRPIVDRSSVDRSVVDRSVPAGPVLEVLAPEGSDAGRSLQDTLATFRAQHRECWICAHIAALIEAGKKVSEDEQWHFSTCVHCWECVEHKHES